MTNTRQLASAIQLPHVGYRIAFIGDSLCEHAHTKSYSGTPDVTGTLTNLSGMQESWIQWLQTLSYGAIQCPVWADPTNYSAGWLSTGYPRGFFGMNFGVNGQTSAEILARLDGSVTPCVLDLDFDVAFYGPGSNDLSGGVNPDTTVSNIIAGLDILLAAGKFVFLLPVRARSIAGAGSWTSASNSRKKVRYINQLVRDHCRRRSNVFIIDWDRAWADSTTADGEPITGYTIDQVHDAIPGGYAIAKYMWFGKIGSVQVWSGLQAFFPLQEQVSSVREDIYDATYNPYGNLLPNGTLQGTAGTANGTNGATGTVADSCTVERSSASGSTTVAASKATPGDNSGYQQISTFTPGGVAAETFYIPRGTTTTITVSALVGKWIQGWVDVEVSAAYDKINSIENYINEVQPNITYRGGVGQSGSFLPNETWKGRIFTPCIKIQVGTTQIRPRIQTVITGGGTGSPVIKVSKWDVRQIPDPRLAYGWTGLTYGE